MSIAENFKKTESKYGIGGGLYLKLDNGEYRFRILTQWESMAEHWIEEEKKYVVCVGIDNGCSYHGEDAPKDDKGNPKNARVRFETYVLFDGSIKIADLPYSIVKKLVGYSTDPDWAFDTFPMPYDVKVLVDKKKAPSEMYEVRPTPNRDAIKPEILEALEKKIPVSELIAKKKEKAESILLDET